MTFVPAQLDQRSGGESLLLSQRPWRGARIVGLPAGYCVIAAAATICSRASAQQHGFMHKRSAAEGPPR